MYKKILVPLDGSERAEAILPHVKNLALCFKAKVIFFIVLEPRHFMAVSLQECCSVLIALCSSSVLEMANRITHAAYGSLKPDPVSRLRGTNIPSSPVQPRGELSAETVEKP
jgi:hypothetical protein